MPLAEDLIAMAEQKILDFQAMGGSQEQIKQQYLAMWALQPGGLGVISRSSTDMQDFAEAIEPNRAQLRPWVLVYPAAAGALGPWETTLSYWCRNDIPANDVINPDVLEILRSLFTGYARLIAI